LRGRETCTDTWTERQVAIKLMLTASGSVDPELAQRFMREARAATKIAHENIVQILDMGQDAADGSLYIVQEFLTGTDLRHVLDKRGAISPKETVEILAPVMSALIAAHKHSIVHCDLKPDNIFLTKSSSGATVPKLIDFMRRRASWVFSIVSRRPRSATVSRTSTRAHRVTAKF